MLPFSTPVQLHLSLPLTEIHYSDGLFIGDFEHMALMSAGSSTSQRGACGVEVVNCVGGPMKTMHFWT